MDWGLVTESVSTCSQLMKSLTFEPLTMSPSLRVVDEIFVLPSEGSIKGEGTFVATLVVDTTSCIVPSVAF